MSSLQETIPARIAALGPITQLAYVPEDFDAAVHFWSRTLGVGQMFYGEHIAVDSMRYRSSPVKIDYDIAVGFLGDMQIELIRQHDETPSVFCDWNPDRMHHIQITVPDYDVAIAACAEQGLVPIMEGCGVLGMPDFRFTFLELQASAPFGYLELAYVPDRTAHLGRMAYLQTIAREWDGREALLPFDML